MDERLLQPLALQLVPGMLVRKAIRKDTKYCQWMKVILLLNVFENSIHDKNHASKFILTAQATLANNNALNNILLIIVD